MRYAPAALWATCLLTALPTAAQENADVGFAAPQLLMVGDQEMGSTSLYPSPVLLDIDGDGVREMVIGGLRGYLSVARRTPDGWGAEVRLKATDGRDLKFNNW
ncbi:MAG: hypothetical protein ACYTKC_17195 [Planctomycetota bacterium]